MSSKNLDKELCRTWTWILLKTAQLLTVFKSNVAISFNWTQKIFIKESHIISVQGTVIVFESLTGSRETSQPWLPGWTDNIHLDWIRLFQEPRCNAQGTTRVKQPVTRSQESSDAWTYTEHFGFSSTAFVWARNLHSQCITEGTTRDLKINWSQNPVASAATCEGENNTCISTSCRGTGIRDTRTQQKLNNVYQPATGSNKQYRHQTAPLCTNLLGSQSLAEDTTQRPLTQHVCTTNLSRSPERQSAHRDVAPVYQPVKRPSAAWGACSAAWARTRVSRTSGCAGVWSRAGPWGSPTRAPRRAWRAASARQPSGSVSAGQCWGHKCRVRLRHTYTQTHT